MASTSAVAIRVLLVMVFLRFFQQTLLGQVAYDPAEGTVRPQKWVGPELVKSQGASAEGLVTWPDWVSDGSNCGLACMDAMLRLSKVPFDRDQLASLLPASEAGTSLSEMQRAAQALGLPLQNREVRDLSQLRGHLPCIALLSDGTDRVGHYVVIFKLTNDGIAYYDATSQTLKRGTIEAFANLHSGYVLVPDSSAAQERIWNLSLWLSACASSLVAVGSIVRLVRKRHA